MTHRQKNILKMSSRWRICETVRNSLCKILWEDIGGWWLGMIWSLIWRREECHGDTSCPTLEESLMGSSFKFDSCVPVESVDDKEKIIIFVHLKVWVNGNTKNEMVNCTTCDIYRPYTSTCFFIRNCKFSYLCMVWGQFASILVFFHEFVILFSSPRLTQVHFPQQLLGVHTWDRVCLKASVVHLVQSEKKVEKTKTFWSV
jgi:hypothetical protein